MAASGYLIQNWDQTTGLMTLTGASFTSLLDVLPHHSYELPDEKVLAVNCMEVSIL